jgi:hypothetical protein
MRAALGLAILPLLLAGQAAGASGPDAAYPFIGNWIRSDRACSASTARERIYTAKDVTSNRGKCGIRRVAHGSGGFEIFERCERPNEKPANVSEIIRMAGPDAMVLTRRTARLKLSRSLHFTRCNTVAPNPGKPGR